MLFFGQKAATQRSLSLPAIKTCVSKHKTAGPTTENAKCLFPFFCCHTHSTLTSSPGCYPLALQNAIFHFQSCRWRLCAVQSLSRRFGISIRRQSVLLSLTQLWCIFAFSQSHIWINTKQNRDGTAAEMCWRRRHLACLRFLYASSNYTGGGGVSLSREHLK